VLRTSVERRLAQVSTRLRRSREELSVVEEQLTQLAAEADDARIRAMVSETPQAAKEHAKAARHADAMQRRREELHRDLAELERRQDELLDELTADKEAG
jgi:hypothetical protein